MVLGGKWGVILVILEWCVCVRAPIGRKSKLDLYVPEVFARNFLMPNNRVFNAFLDKTFSGHFCTYIETQKSIRCKQ